MIVNLVLCFPVELLPKLPGALCMRKSQRDANNNLQLNDFQERVELNAQQHSVNNADSECLDEQLDLEPILEPHKHLHNQRYNC